MRRRDFFVGSASIGTTWAAGLPNVARAAGEKILRVAIGGFPQEKGNPFANIQTPAIILSGALFDGLTRLNRDGSLSPRLATSWESIDPLTWRFKLRDDVVFSNGKTFTADAVVHTVKYLVAPGPATEGVRRDFPFLADAKAIDKRTVDIITKTPVPGMPRYAAVLLIPEPDAWQSLGAEKFSLTPVGTGSLKAESWEPGRIYFSANKTSWVAPKIDGVEFLLLTDIPSRLQAMLSGRLDVVYQVPPEDFSTVTDFGGTVITARDAAASAIFFNFPEGRDTPLKDVRVRRAINMAIDRQTIVEVLLDGKTTLSSQPAIKESFGYDPSIKPYPYDVAGARKLLAEAGYPNGFAMVLETSAGSTNAAAIVQRVADDLTKVGIKMEIRAKPVIQYLNDFVFGRITADALTMQWGSYPTLDAIQMTVMSSCRKTNPWYCDRTIQPTIDAAWAETDPKKALELRQQVMRYYHDNAPGIFLYDNVQFIGLSPRTSGFGSVFGFVDFENVKIA